MRIRYPDERKFRKTSRKMSRRRYLPFGEIRRQSRMMSRKTISRSNCMERKEEIAKLCKDRAEAADLVEEILFLESKLTELKKLPFYKVHPTDNCKQKVLPAAKLYKEMLQQYTNCLKLLLNFVDDANTDEESPLRKWIAERGKKFVNKGEENMDTG
nr:MAG TPA: hypothetical protein [Caudoviricetes sp.]